MELLSFMSLALINYYAKSNGRTVKSLLMHMYGLGE